MVSGIGVGRQGGACGIEITSDIERQLGKSGLGPRNPADSALETLRLDSGRAESPTLGDGCAILREPDCPGIVDVS